MTLVEPSCGLLTPYQTGLYTVVMSSPLPHLASLLRTVAMGLTSHTEVGRQTLAPSTCISKTSGRRTSPLLAQSCRSHLLCHSPASWGSWAWECGGAGELPGIGDSGLAQRTAASLDTQLDHRYETEATSAAADSLIRSAGRSARNGSNNRARGNRSTFVCAVRM